MANWGIHTNGNANNGGGFRGSALFADAHDSGGTPGDPLLSVTNATFTNATKTIGGLAGAAVAGMVDVYVYLDHASEPETWEIYVESITDVNSLVLDAIPAGWDVNLTDVTITIGGFFSSIEDLISTGADVITAGDTVQWIDGMTDEVGANNDFVAGTAGDYVVYESVDSSGAVIVVERDEQGSDGQKSGKLITTGMSTIDMGTTYRCDLSSYNVFRNLHFSGARNGIIMSGASSDGVNFLDCVIRNTNTTVEDTICQLIILDDSCVIKNCDLIADSTTTTSSLVTIGNGGVFDGCWIESKSTDSAVELILSSFGYNMTVTKCVLIGGGAGKAIVPHARLIYTTSILSNTFYNFDYCVRVVTVHSANSLVALTDNLVVDCTNFVHNTQSSAVNLFSVNNVLPPTGTMAEADRYDGNLAGFYENYDTISADDADDTFETPGSDFRPEDTAEALGIAAFGADAGAVRNLGTGGGGGAASHGTITGGMQ